MLRFSALLAESLLKQQFYAAGGPLEATGLWHTSNTSNDIRSSSQAYGMCITFLPNSVLLLLVFLVLSVHYTSLISTVLLWLYHNGCRVLEAFCCKLKLVVVLYKPAYM